MRAQAAHTSCIWLQGVRQDQIIECEPGLKLPEIGAALNALLGQHRMEMLQDREGVPVFKAKSAAEAAK